MSYKTFAELADMQKQTLAEKVQYAVEWLRGAFALDGGKAIAFSGGKDSTVLWHIIRTYFPEARPYIIFGNTGVEYPESLAFARKLGSEWGGERFIEARPSKTEREGLKYEAQREVMMWLVDTGRIHGVLKADGKLRNTEALENMATPEMWDGFRERNLVWRAGTTKSYWWCVDQYGWPIMGKAACKLDARRINIDCFLRYSKSDSADPKLLQYYDLIREVKISQHCCTVLKKEPSQRICEERGIQVTIMGIMAAESRRRMISFCENGPLYQLSSGKYHCHPMGIWTDDDVWQYIRENDVPYSPLYEMGFTDSKGEFHNIKRNGCFGCCTDIQFPNNHMSMLRRTHPELWQLVMEKGMAEQLQRLRQYRANGMISIFDTVGSVKEIMDFRPCVFDSIDRLIVDDDTFTEYDPEEDT